MALTKTKFLEYTRCPKYVHLEKINEDILQKKMTYQEYQEEEKKLKLQELFGAMFESDNNGDLVSKLDKVNPQLEAMLPYYKQVELEAGRIAQEMFGGKCVYNLETQDQVSFECDYKNTKLLCYVDIYNETEDTINIIEVKATTSRKYRELSAGYPKKWKHSIFKKKDNIYFLKEEVLKDITKEMPLKNYEKERDKLKDRFGLGNYVYDLAFQRFVIEQAGGLTKNIHYYLAVLNDEYVYDGWQQEGKNFYHTDQNGQELITFLQMDTLTFELQDNIKKELDTLFENLKVQDFSCPLGVTCGYKKMNQCKYFGTVCAHDLPKENSSLSYIHNPFGFVKEDHTRIKGLDLLNEGYFKMLDIPEKWITRPAHQIQRGCLEKKQEFWQPKKIAVALQSLEYPIYHLDFETFPCPIPRFKGEKPYTQSPFEFSLHIERAPGVCDKEKDNVLFLARSTKDEREDLIKTLLQHVDVHKGTLFAQNVAFEKGRIKELAECFPEYKKDLLLLVERAFDLLWIINTNKTFYLEKGFSEEESELFNFYDARLSGSFSIKKTLPVFSSLSYQNLEVKNGTEAIVVYAMYDKMSEQEFEEKYQALLKYCQQDTWAMVEIMNALRQKISSVNKLSKNSQVTCMN